MDEIRATFFEECQELLEQLESGLLQLQAGETSSDTVDAVFRAVHSIKGGAGAFDLGDLVTFAHCFETALDGLRSGSIKASGDVIVTLLRACDRLGDLVAAAADDRSSPAGIPDDLADLAKRSDSGRESATEQDRFTPLPTDLAELDPAASPTGWEADRWLITFEPLADLFRSGNEPLFLLRALQVFGHVEARLVEDDLPGLVDLDPTVPRLRWTIRLTPTAPDLTETEIENVFEFAQDLCALTIEHEGIAPPAAGYSDTETSPGEAIETTPLAALGPAEVGQQSTPASPKSSTVRVDLSRIDRLVDLVGELVICQSMLAQEAAEDGRGQSSGGLDDLQQLTRDIQDSVMAIRAQPVRSLFQRMTRIVREGAQLTGKSVRLVTEGESTEIDKTVVERLAEPLTHMIRNSIDHGIEPTASRIEVGKDRTGTIRLSARQKSDRVIVEVSDDGSGIDRDRVLARARERGLVPEDVILEPSDIDRLLFVPGFSTASEVSSLSGRGVGMDVVQRYIRELNGLISIRSQPGTGTTVSISLPLTLAVLDGMIVRSAGQRMVIPLASIIETQTVESARIEPISESKSVARLQGRFVPLVELSEGMGLATAIVDTERVQGEDSALLFLQPDDAEAYALRVDAIEAQRQVVIKGLSESFGHVPCVSAATILGDGQVAFIVDPGGLAVMTKNQTIVPQPEACPA